MRGTSRIEYIDFVKARRKLEREIREARFTKKKVGLQILYIQLLNGCRISEAYDAYYEWVKDPSRREVSVRTRKKKKVVYRLVVIPDGLEPINKRVNIRSVIRLCRNVLGVTTHSLRYAYITYLSTKMNVPFQVIAKITKHANPAMVEYYTHQIIATELQRRIVKEGEKVR